jgi:hypothetical protein
VVSRLCRGGCCGAVAGINTLALWSAIPVRCRRHPKGLLTSNRKLNVPGTLSTRQPCPARRAQICDVLASDALRMSLVLTDEIIHEGECDAGRNPDCSAQYRSQECLPAIELLAVLHCFSNRIALCAGQENQRSNHGSNSDAYRQETKIRQHSKQLPRNFHVLGPDPSQSDLAPIANCKMYFSQRQSVINIR